MTNNIQDKFQLLSIKRLSMKKNILIFLLFTLCCFYLNAQDYYKIGLEKFENYQYQLAIDDFSKFIKDNKTSSKMMLQINTDNSYYDRAVCNFYILEFDKAISDCDEYIRRNGAFKEYASSLKAVILYYKKEYKDAYKELNTCLNNYDGKKASALYFRALINKNFNDTDSYLDGLHTVIAIDKKTDYKAFALQLIGKPDEALQYMKKNMKKKPTAEKYYDLATLYIMQGNTNEALINIEKFLSMGFKPLTIQLDEFFNPIFNNNDFINLLSKYNFYKLE